jgi:thioredoxin-like negative regulator of GroEL
MDAGLYALAWTRLNRLSQERADDAEVVFQLGRCLAARGQTDGAMKLWARIPLGAPWAVPAALEHARAAISLGRLAEAEQVLRAVIHRPSPEHPAVRHLLLTLLGQQGRTALARRLIQSLWQDRTVIPAADMSDRLRLLREHMGLDLEPFPLEWNLGQLQEGSATATADDRLTLAAARAHLATRAGDFGHARQELEWCLRQRPEDPAVWKTWLDWAVASGQGDLAAAALDHIPADLLEEDEILSLRAWFARQGRDIPGERAALEQLVALAPSGTGALTRLAEIDLQAGAALKAATMRRRKDELDAALDRYSRLYRADRLVDHLPELASLAERLGRQFEAAGFWELLALREPANAGAARALQRLRAARAPRPAQSGSLAQVLGEPDLMRRSPPRSRDKKGGELPAIPRFEDRAASSGLAAFVQDNGVSPIHQLPEMSSGGVGLLDFDGDGWLDVYCVQGGPFPPRTGGRSADRLFRNRGDGTFEDYTEKSGLSAMPGGYGHGVAVGDYDNDGHPDLFITRWRSYALYRNRGDGTFEDKTAQAGLGGDRDWPTSAAFADLDNDRDLDLYVCHYGAWDTKNPRVCKDPSGTVVLACDPRLIESLPDHVFCNDGGRFVDVTAQSGIIDRDGRGLGVVAADLDDDGRVDLFVANDTTANFLYLNRGSWRFEEVAHSAGVAANDHGGYQAGMGIACGDLDGDGRIDLAVTNYYGESTTLFHNLGGGIFADHSAATGLAAPSRHRLGFGAACLDANNDSWVDLLTANGHVSDSRPLFPYAMTAQLYLGTSRATLWDATVQAGPPFQQLKVGRGLAVGDLDNDGCVDAVMVAQNEPPVYFHNESAADRGGSHFVTIHLQGTASNRDGVGAVVTVTAGGRTQMMARFGGGSFQSAGDPRLHFGLGPIDRVDSIEVRWPSGRVDRHQNLRADRGYRVREGDLKVKDLASVRPRR